MKQHMGLRTDTTTWERGREPTRLKDEIVAFLRENEGVAFTYYDIADEVADSNWGNIFSDGDSEEWLEGEGFEMFGQFIGGTLTSSVALTGVREAINELRQEGVLEDREFDPAEVPEDLTYPSGSEEVLLVTYIGDANE